MMDGWTERARDRGERFGFSDLLIAARAREADVLVWSLDADFARMSKLKFIELFD